MALGALGFAAPAGAAESFGQAEWAQRYDLGARLTVARSTTPLLSPRTLAATEQAIEQYRAIVANGGWGKVPSGANLKLGSIGSGGAGPAPPSGRHRRPLDASASTSGIYDSYVEAGVKHFQARHGLIESGVANATTVDAMNVPADYRLRQLETNIVRLRTFATNLGDRFVTANIPAAMVETVENDTVATYHCGGRRQNRSPVAGHADPRARYRFQSLLDGACLDHPQGSHPQDAG